MGDHTWAAAPSGVEGMRPPAGPPAGRGAREKPPLSPGSPRGSSGAPPGRPGEGAAGARPRSGQAWPSWAHPAAQGSVRPGLARGRAGGWSATVQRFPKGVALRCHAVPGTPRPPPGHCDRPALAESGPCGRGGGCRGPLQSPSPRVQQTAPRAPQSATSPAVINHGAFRGGSRPGPGQASKSARSSWRGGGATDELLPRRNRSSGGMSEATPPAPCPAPPGPARRSPGSLPGRPARPPSPLRSRRDGSPDPPFAWEKS